MPRLLVVYHSRSGRTSALKDAIVQGIQEAQGLEVSVLRAESANEHDVIAADGFVFGTPENFGAMSGLFKDFLERIYYPAQERVGGKPYALFVACGNDGQGAVLATRRILRGLQLKEVQEPLIWREGTEFPAEHAHTLGLTMAMGLTHALW